MFWMILRFLFIFIIGYFLYKVLWKGEGFSFFKTSSTKKRNKSPKELEEMKKDPICGTYLPENQAIKYNSAGEIYFFCSEECRKKFSQIHKK